MAAAALVSFVRWELLTPEPMLDVRLFALRGFSTGTLALTVQFLCLFGFFLVGLQFLLLMLGLQPAAQRSRLLPLGAIVMPMSRVAPHLVDRFGQRAVMSAGLALLGAGSASCRSSTATRRTGTSSVVSSSSASAWPSRRRPRRPRSSRHFPVRSRGWRSAVNDVSRELGSALGIAILGSLFNSGYRNAVSDATGRAAS